MSVVSVRQAVRRFWWLGLVVFLGCTALGVLLAVGQAERYSATSQVLVRPSEELGSNIQGIRFVLPSLAEQVNSPQNFLATREALPPPVRDADWDVAIATDDETLVLSITAESERKDVVVPAANGFANQIVQGDEGGRLVVFTLLEAATEATSNSAARRVLVLGGIALGAVLGVLAMLSAQALLPRVSRGEDVRRMGVPVLGVVPLEPASRPASEVMGAAGATADAYERVAVGLDAARSRVGAPAIAVLSLERGEGSTRVAANLGWALAAMGHQVGLIDADLRYPGLHWALRMENQDGLADGAEPRRVPGSPAGPLWATTAGRVRGNSLEVVNGRLPGALSRHEQAGAGVLVDAPALDESADALVVAGLARSAVLVIRAGAHPPKELSESIAELGDAGVILLGVVLTTAGRSGRDGSRPPAGTAARPPRARASAAPDPQPARSER